MRPLSTVGDAYTACKRIGLCSGDFVRAEGRAVAAVSGDGGSRGNGEHGRGISDDGGRAAVPFPTDSKPPTPVKKDDVLTVGCAILRLQTTRKSQWQQ